MYSVTRHNIKVTKESKIILNKIGIRTPHNAKMCEYLGVQGDKTDVAMYTFKDSDSKLIKRLKCSTDVQTNEKTVEARFYKYLGVWKKKRKLAEVSSYTFNASNECTGSKTWHFYHPEEKGSVYFSRSTQQGRTDNFIKTNDSFVDSNGLRFKPISTAEFLERKRTLGRKKFVDAPWTIEQSITGNNVVTDSVQECTVFGVVGKKGVSLDHFNPNNPKNYDINKLENFMKDQIKEQGADAKAFVIGSCERDVRSNEQFNAIIDFLAVNKVPFSYYKTGDKILYTDFYRAKASTGTIAGKQLKEGTVTPEYNNVGQNIIYNGNNEILINNLIIDKELRRGNFDAKSLIRKSFSKIG